MNRVPTTFVIRPGALGDTVFVEPVIAAPKLLSEGGQEASSQLAVRKAADDAPAQLFT